MNLVAAGMSPLQLMTGREVSAAPRRRWRCFPDAACLAWSLLLLSPFIATAQTDPPPVSYVRSFINDVPDRPGVTVSVYGATDVASFTIEEKLPNPATALDISDGGVYLPEQNVIRWGPYSDMASVSVSYRLTGLPASYPVDGGAWMDGQWYFSPGVTLVTVLPATADDGLATQPPRVDTPEFVPVGGGNVPVAVTISCDTAGAEIYYTTDGSLPDESSTLYTGAVHLETAGVIRAVAFKTDWTRSMASVAYYGPTAPPADAVVAREITGNSTESPMVTFTLTSPGGSAIAVTETLPPGVSANDVSDGGHYDALHHVVRWGPFLASDTIPSSLSYTVQAPPGEYPVSAAWSVDGVSGSEATATNLVITGTADELATPPQRVATPTFDPVSGGDVPVDVTIACTNEGAVIYYTTDGSLPNDVDSMLYTDAVHLETAGVIRAVAFKTDWTRSMASVAYYGPTAPPADAAVARSVTGNSTASPQVALEVSPGLSAQCVTVTETLPPGVSANPVSHNGHYDEVNHVVRWGPFLGTIPSPLSYTVQAPPGEYPVSAAWSVDGVSGSEATATNLVITGTADELATPPQRVATPVIEPAMAAIPPSGSVTVEISSDSTVRYTLDGSLPTESSTLYTPGETVLTFNERMTLRAVAFPPAGSTDLRSMAAVGEYSPEVITPEVGMNYSVSGEGGFSPTIVNTVTPGDTVDCYAVVETIPYGLLPSGFGDGIWDPIAREIRWGPYLEDHTEREFSYNIEGASVSFPLSGRVSVNGYTAATTEAATVQIDENFIGSEPVTDLAACATIHLSYNVNINPAPGIITVTSASGTVNWGDGTTTAITTPAMTLQKAYSVPGTYDIVISAHWEGHNSAGDTKTGHATNVRKPDQIQVVTDCVAPQIVAQPYDQAVLVGSNVLFTVSASSSVPMSYQWYFNETFPIVGARASSLALPAVQAPSAGTYLVIITNVFGSVISDSATLTVVTPHSTGVTIGSDGSISFTFKTLPYTSSRIWGATELRPPIEWQLLATVISDANGDCTFVDDEVADFPARFLTITTP